MSESDPEEVIPTVKAATSVLREHLAFAQTESGSPESELLVASNIIPHSGPYWQGPSRTRSLASLALLSVLIGAIAMVAVSEFLHFWNNRTNALDRG